LTGKVWFDLVSKEDIVAPIVNNKNHGKRGYVPVKKRFERMIVNELSSTLSPQSPIPWTSGSKI
jgi:hypothetical protein